MYAASKDTMYGMQERAILPFLEGCGFNLKNVQGSLNKHFCCNGITIIQHADL